MFLSIGFACNTHANPGDVTVTFRVRGVFDTKISILYLQDSRLFKPLTEVPGIRNGDSATLTIPASQLPGEFVFRFDYREKGESTPYPSEKHCFVSRQNLVLDVHPMYCNNPDSTRFQPWEIENGAFTGFSIDNAQKKEMLTLIQTFLLKYDEPQSDFYRSAMREYEKRRTEYNRWLDDQINQHRDLFVSSLFRFQYVPQSEWSGTDRERLLSMIQHYFDGMDFGDAMIIRTSAMNKWMDNYVNLHGQLVTTYQERDSILPSAARKAIDLAKKGNPMVYGWMVDYFYRGFESNAIDAGIKALEPYLADTTCLTSKRMEIERRLRGIATLVEGSKAPGITLADPAGQPFQLAAYDPGTPYLLILFWAAGCSHCAELVHQLYPWSTKPEVTARLKVLAISFDDNETDIDMWFAKTGEYPAWKHLNAPEGVNSQTAADYFVLATPVMVLIHAKSKEVIATPVRFSEVKKLIFPD
jgi:hypothetical protein